VAGRQVPPFRSPPPAAFSAKAKRVIFLYMSGGVSHIDSWDPKPKLFADAGKTVPVNEFQGRKGDFNMFLKRPQWEFAPHGNAARRSARSSRIWRSASTTCA
jgi:hypothetical protein